MKFLTKTLLTLSFSAFALAAKPLAIETVSLEQAQNAIQACVKKAKANNWAMAVVVVDYGSNVKASILMDGALSPASTGATLKAKTSLSWWSPTEKVAQIVQKEPNFKQFPGLLPIGGGVPLFSKSGNIIGAVGVAGSMVENDIACAKAAASAI